MNFDIDEDYIVYSVANDDYGDYDHEAAAETLAFLRELKAAAWDEGFSDGWDRGHYESGNETNPYRIVKGN